jgi:hypothetical protein
MRASLLRYIYRGLLRELAIEDVRGFFRVHPLTMSGRRPTEQDVYRAFWSGRQLVPLAYVLEIMNHLEPFLVSHGKSIYGFVHSLCVDASAYCIAPPREVLRLIEPFLGLVYRVTDPRHAILKFAGRIHQSQVPGSTFSLVYHDRGEEVRRDLLRGVAGRPAAGVFLVPPTQAFPPLAHRRNVGAIQGHPPIPYPYFR